MRYFSNVSLNKSSFIKAIIVGVATSVCLIAILMCITAGVLLISSQIPYEYLEYIMLVIDAVAVFLGGYIASRINKSQGMFLGLINGAIVLLAVIIGGFCSSTDTITYITLIKAVVILVFSILGGIKGVNVKDRIHIK